MSQPSLNITKAVHPIWRDQIVVVLLAAIASIAILVTVGIVFSLIVETLQFLEKAPLRDFLFGLKWSPQTAIRTDQVGSGGSFGILPLINGTLLISAIAMVVATPLGLGGVFIGIFDKTYAGLDQAGVGNSCGHSNCCLRIFRGLNLGTVHSNDGQSIRV